MSRQRKIEMYTMESIMVNQFMVNLWVRAMKFWMTGKTRGYIHERD